MASDRWRQVEDLFHAALTRRAEQRGSFLAEACQGDAALLREVESLLAQESSQVSATAGPQPDRTMTAANLLESRVKRPAQALSGVAPR
jgi:hypothetical protein